ncbi:unnamed protein product [Cylindrotheca closterium]|uniref:CCHC-type domain-containing protein n=1 Tax=Cylindrotheca closterium TaxID=2856 RepID=A0AAD2CZG4_9STRA|nr:unnamed protein product [Cylindrotheca closterium]
MANGFLYNSDRAKYQSRIDGMTAQYTLKHLDFKQRCTFPTTLENAADVLNQHKHDNRKKNLNGGNSNGQGKQNKSNNNQNDGAQFSQQQTRACFVCGSKDHVAPQCADKLKPREKWKNPDKYRDYSDANGRGNRQNMQRDDNATRDDNESGDSNTQWNYGHSNNGSHGGQFIQRGHTDNHPRQQGMMLFQHNNTGIHLDSGSTFHLRTNEDDFKEGSLQGIDGGFHYSSNVEGRNLYQEGIDKVFDSVCKLDTRASDNVNSLLNMVQDGFDVFIKNCPITEEDVNISEKIYGPSVSTIKGKQKRPTPKAVVDDWIEMPKELLKYNSNLDLCIDIMFINNVAFFVSIDKAIKFRFSTELKNRTKDAIYKSIDEILRIYNHAEF